MYLKKAKRYFDVPDTKDVGEKRERNCEQSNSHAICMGMLRAANSSSSAALPTTTADVLSFVNDDLAVEQQTTPTESEKEFHPEDLPDGACFRPKSVLVNSDTDHTAIRPAEYIGSFSVIGVDQGMRTNFVKKHLEDMRDVVKSIKVLLVISLSGVKVCSSKGESVYMAHALKRISFATCDPDYCQFSFLAREPKGQINVQFCHAFVTRNSPEAEELNTIIGNAFKMAYAQQRQRQPTFNELIERQIQEQKAKFAEDQEQAERDLQQKLNEIATPTPFSEKAIQRMEMRRQLSEETAQEREKELAQQHHQQQQQQHSSTATLRSWLWGRQTTERVKHRSPVTELLSLTSDRGSPPPALIKPSSSPAHLRPQPHNSTDHSLHGQQRNSVPPGPKLSSIQNRPLPALPIDRNGHSKSSIQRSSLQNLSSTDDGDRTSSSCHVPLRESVHPYNPRRRESSPKTKGQRPLSGAAFDIKKSYNGYSRALSCDASYYGYRSSVHCPQASPLVKQQSFPETESTSLQQLYTLEGHGKHIEEPCLPASCPNNSSSSITDHQHWRPTLDIGRHLSPMARHSRKEPHAPQLPYSQPGPTSSPQSSRYQNDSLFQYQGYYDSSIPNSPSSVRCNNSSSGTAAAAINLILNRPRQINSLVSSRGVWRLY
ncbi:SH2 domain-containing 5 [Octopus vulgaris]|uniref:SH2 domain-containing 5 n=1 Tax=Octopus vulgaris TaxID=6645 RepID=A0AA36FJS1_OCTVU|nr:SH2 domain-containing 5 [Octopus vulgaris]